MRCKQQKVSNLSEKITQRKKLVRVTQQISSVDSVYHFNREVKASRTNAQKCQRYDELREAVICLIDPLVLLTGNYLLFVLHNLSEFEECDHVEYGEDYEREKTLDEQQKNGIGFESECFAELCECPECSCFVQFDYSN